MTDKGPRVSTYRRANRLLEDPVGGDPEPLAEAERVASEAWRNLIGADGYLPVLVLIFAAVISGPMLGDSKFGSVFTLVVAAAALVLTIFRSSRHLKVRRLSLTLVSISTTISAGAVVSSDVDPLEFHWISVLMTMTYLTLLLIAFPLVLFRSLQHRRVTLNTVCATLAAYLLIGLIFTLVYRLIGLMAPPFFSQTSTPTPGQYAYFSFVTLTTVGYGDLTAASDPSRGFVMIEAILGQVFLVTTMARVVSLLGEDRAFSLPPHLSKVDPVDEDPRPADPLDDDPDDPDEAGRSDQPTAPA